MNSYAKFGGAARRHFSAICEKPMGGAHMCPPGRARVNVYMIHYISSSGLAIEASKEYLQRDLAKMPEAISPEPFKPGTHWAFSKRNVNET